MPTFNPSLTPAATWTPLPTLSSQQAVERVAALLSDNGGCQIPCWWGIEPNKTTWPEARHLLSPFSEIRQGGSGSFTEGGQSYRVTNFGVYYPISNQAEPGYLSIGVQNDIVVGIIVDRLGSEQNYQLHQLLKLFGVPEQTFISAQQSSIVPELPPAMLILDYSSYGIWVAYGYTPSRSGEILSICPTSIKANAPSSFTVKRELVLFDPGDKLRSRRALSIYQYADIVGGFSAKKLEEATNMTAEVFFDTFIDPKSTECLETPADLWP
jgi:hypothetical protein